MRACKVDRPLRVLGRRTCSQATRVRVRVRVRARVRVRVRVRFSVLVGI